MVKKKPYFKKNWTAETFEKKYYLLLSLSNSMIRTRALQEKRIKEDNSLGI